jgi:hypothetical protein
MTAIRHYHQRQKSIAATRASQLASASDPVEKTRLTVRARFEEARGQERIKKLILDYEKAYLKSLKRERADRWW